ncbi:MAG: carbonic anhydrase [Alcaligenaceae bacterium]
MCFICDDKNAIHETTSEANATRRSFLKYFGATPFVLGGLGLNLTACAQVAKDLPSPGNVMTPDEALKRVVAGNQRYVSGTTTTTNFQTSSANFAKGQNPFVSVLSCADSRVSPESTFDEDRGDVFVTRVAGNYASVDILASLEYGSAVLGVPLIIVLGHTDCGAMKATIKAKKENAAFPGHIQVITTALGDAVDVADKMPGDLLENTTKANIKLNVDRLQTATPILRGLVSQGKLKVIGMLYNLKTGKLEVVA